MKRILLSLIATSTVVMGAANVTDYFLKGQAAISQLQDFNFALEFNLFTTGGAQTTVQEMQRLKNSVGASFAASGCAAAYTELFDSDGVYAQLQYLKDHITWPRVTYSQWYTGALNNQQCSQTLNGAIDSLEKGMQALYTLTDVKLHDPQHIDEAKTNFLATCGTGKCEGALKVLISAINGGDFDPTFGCDLGERIFKGAPMMSQPLFRGHRDLGLMMFSGIYNYAMVGFMLHSAYMTINTANISAWLGV